MNPLASIRDRVQFIDGPEQLSESSELARQKESLHKNIAEIAIDFAPLTRKTTSIPGHAPQAPKQSDRRRR